MSNSSDNSWSFYQYDALDRLVSCTPAGQQQRDRFYQHDRLVTEIQGALQHQIFQAMDVLLAENHNESTQHTSLLITDKQRSVLQSTDGKSVYAPYGHRTGEAGSASRLAFNGERRDTTTGHYLLGNGHRAFNPVLMRFNSPDSLSPFGEGGLNCYAYCLGDPINRTDPTGRIPHGILWFTNGLMDFAGNYVLPSLVPKRLARQIPFVAGADFGSAAKIFGGVSAFGGTVTYLLLNRMEAHHPDSPVNDPLLIALVTMAAVSFLTGFGFLLHKRAQLPWVPKRTKPRSNSLPDMSPGFGDNASSSPAVMNARTSQDFGVPRARSPSPSPSSNLAIFNMKIKFESGDFRLEKGVVPISKRIRRSV